MFKQKRDPAPDKPRLEPADAVQQARTRARQRLIGAIVLLAIGIIGFPLVFETQPRPIPVDMPIEIPRRDALPPLAMPPARRRREPAPATSPPLPASRPRTAQAAPQARRRGDHRVARRRGTRGRCAASAASAAPRVAAAVDAGAQRVVGRAARRRPSTPARRAAPRRRRGAGIGAGRRAASTGRRRARPRAARGPAGRRSADEQRFVVQVGAFADAEAARETRKNVEKLGLKTYTQVAQTSSGSRIRVRVGPFASRGEAEAALAKAKAAGLDGRAAHAVNAR